MPALKFMWKTDASNVGNCPALYESDDTAAAGPTEGRDGYVVQGKLLNAEARAQLRDLGSDEDAIWVPADVIERIRETV